VIVPEQDANLPELAGITVLRPPTKPPLTPCTSKRVVRLCVHNVKPVSAWPLESPAVFCTAGSCTSIVSASARCRPAFVKRLYPSSKAGQINLPVAPFQICEFTPKLRKGRRNSAELRMQSTDGAAHYDFSNNSAQSVRASTSFQSLPYQAQESPSVFMRRSSTYWATLPPPDSSSPSSST